ncbi:Sulfate adenylyltransferase subunit 1 [Anaerohalosphaera lusitana]|uniref:sulfate adenylyltransferase n=1 Tax=Anaerohalosphaera lusitana TaxID=1936003 RepID=A0A1U9NG24_9BACT|nr:GTP-binding protein [Anaerohalosphaera lusitana]AQT66882.1 Sulfate adenylyltransferase subunit 1 [Anaerohalosphaera lusitana]
MKTAEAEKQVAREHMNIVIAGHVDHGKSTVIGRMLADTNSLPQGKLEQIKERCRRNSKPFEYAFLLDALKDEQSQGITIDSARVFFSSAKREYIIIDAPGHIEFLKNMVTGASRAEAALLVIDAEEGVQENSRRHGYMLSMLGIKQVVVVVNKMDLVDYSEETYKNVKAEYTKFLADIGLEAIFVPVSGMAGDNIVSLSDKMSWYQGATVLESIDGFEKEPPAIDKPFRMPVQDVYKFTQAGDKRRLVVGTIETGQVSVGDELVFYPSGKKSTVKTVERFNVPQKDTAAAGEAIALTLDQQIYVSRGEVAARTSETKPEVTSRLSVNLFWMGRNPMVKGKRYLIKVGTMKEEVELEDVIRVMDGSDLEASETKDKVEHHDVAECVLSTKRAIAFDLAEEIAATGRFVVVDDYEIRGGGIIREGLKDEQVWVRDYVMRRNYKWETGEVSRDDRAERYSQRSSLVLITGQRGVGKKPLAKALEARFFTEGRFVYFLGIGNILYGVDADIKSQESEGNGQRQEHLRRMAEVANVMLDAGMILVVTAVGLTNEDLEVIQTAVDSRQINVVWMGDEPTDIPCDLVLPQNGDLSDAGEAIKTMLQDKGIIYRP